MSDIEVLSRSLQSDRLIEIFVGDEVQSYKIQQSLLTHASEYFVKAIKNSHLGNGKENVLRFPEDDIDAWKVLLHWIMRGVLPPLKDIEFEFMLLSRSWMLGDKYNISEFQDEVMLQLLWELRYFQIDLDVVKASFDGTPPGSKLQKLMAEEVVDLIRKKSDASWKHEQLEVLDGCIGFTTALMKAMDEWDKKKIICVSRMEEDNGKRYGEHWNEYMVGDGPVYHWIYAPVLDV